MRRSHILLSLCSIYCLILTVVLGWSFDSFQNSAPLAHASVKGASTGNTVSNVTLGKYSSIGSVTGIAAKQYALYDVETGRLLTQSKTMQPVPVASTTKLMTAFVVQKIGNLDDVITISKSAVSQPPESSLMGLHFEETISIRNLLFGSLLVSGNDAAFALAEYGGGLLLNTTSATSEQKIIRFVEEMNNEARNLHLEDTKYHDPVGINDDGRSTAIDLAKLTSKILTIPELVTIINTPTITVFDQKQYHHYDLRNSNRLVTEYEYEGSIGGKTGFTPGAGHCLISAATRNGHTLIAVILHTTSNTNDASAIEARKLLDNGFTKASWR